MLCEVLILLVAFVADKSLFLREEKPKALAFGFFVLWRVESANFRKRRKTKKHKRKYYSTKKTKLTNGKKHTKYIKKINNKKTRTKS